MFIGGNALSRYSSRIPLPTSERAVPQCGPVGWNLSYAPFAGVTNRPAACAGSEQLAWFSHIPVISYSHGNYCHLLFSRDALVVLAIIDHQHFDDQFDAAVRLSLFDRCYCWSGCCSWNDFVYSSASRCSGVGSGRNPFQADFALRGWVHRADRWLGDHRQWVYLSAQ